MKFEDLSPATTANLQRLARSLGVVIARKANETDPAYRARLVFACLRGMKAAARRPRK